VDRLALEDLYLLADLDYLLETSNRQDQLDPLDLYNLTFIYQYLVCLIKLCYYCFFYITIITDYYIYTY